MSDTQVSPGVTPENTAPLTGNTEDQGETASKRASAWFAAEVEETAASESEADKTEVVEETPPTTTEIAKDDSSNAEQGEEDDESESGNTKPVKGFEKRIERFNRRLAEKDAEIEFLRKLAGGNAGGQPTPQQNNNQPVQTLQEPKLSDFNGDTEQYTKAVAAWAVDNAFRQVEHKQRAEQVTKSYAQREAEFKKATPDYADVIAEFQEDYKGVNAPEINQYLVESEVGEKVYYYLAKNRAETDRILALPPYRRLGELGKIEAKLAVAGATGKTQAAPKVSKAPAPLAPEKGAAPIVRNLNDPNLPQADYRKQRMATLRRKY